MSKLIWLWSPLRLSTTGVARYPMIVPGSLDFGSVNMAFEYQKRIWQVKVYPRLVHAIKSFNSKLGSEVPKTLHGVAARGKAAVEMIKNLSTLSSSELGGFSIEVTVEASSLDEARRLVDGTPFLDYNFWLDPHVSALRKYRMAVKIVPKAAMLQNANWVYHEAQRMGHFLGNSNVAAQPAQVQTMIDVLASFGWNTGRRDTTKSLSTLAWWITDAIENEQEDIMGHIQRLAGTDTEQMTLLNTVRQHLPGKALPCRKFPDNKKHCYQIKAKQPFRLQCGQGTCKDHMNGGAVIQWYAQLVMDGKLDKTIFGLQPASLDQVSVIDKSSCSMVGK